VADRRDAKSRLGRGAVSGSSHETFAGVLRIANETLRPERRDRRGAAPGDRDETVGGDRGVRSLVAMVEGRSGIPTRGEVSLGGDDRRGAGRARPNQLK